MKYSLLCCCLPLLSGTLICSTPALAQVVPDTTLGTESSVVTPLDAQTDRIDGGALRDAALFHSFEQFNILEGRGAYFTNPDEVNVIFSRVTGENPSDIFGTLGVLGDADLVFLNPSGILFGPNAELDLRGSFVATTASAIELPGGEEFSVAEPNESSLLTVNINQPIGLFFESADPGSIINRGVLSVETGRDIVLASENIVVDGGAIEVRDGQAQLVGISREELSIGELSGNITLSDGATLRAQEGLLTGEGTVSISGENIFLYDRSQIDSLSSEILIDARQLLLLRNQSKMSIFNSTIGSGGDLEISSALILLENDSQIKINNSNYNFGFGTSQFNDSNSSSFESSNISIMADSVNLRGSSVVSGSNFGLNTNGRISILSDQELFVEDSSEISIINSSASSSNPDNERLSGGIDIEANFINLSDDSGIFIKNSGPGRSEDLTIFSRRLQVSDSSKINVGNLTSGIGGDINIVADFINLIDDSEFSSENFGSGIGGDIIVSTDQLFINDASEISAIGSISRQLGNGFSRAGNVLIEARIAALNGQSKIASFTSPNGGSVFLDISGLLFLREESEISVNSFSPNNSAISIAEVIDENLLSITVPFIFSSPYENSDIVSQEIIYDSDSDFVLLLGDVRIALIRIGIGEKFFRASNTRANISISSNYITGIEFRPFSTALSDITIEEGISVPFSLINIVDVLPPPPEEQSLAQVIQECPTVGDSEALYFFNAGRGGTRPNPDDLIVLDTANVDWVSLDLAETPAVNTSESNVAVTDERSTEQLLAVCQGGQR